MNTISRIITGSLTGILGLFLLILYIYSSSISLFIAGVVLVFLGIAIFFNKYEDSIEKIKRPLNKKGSKNK